MHQNPFSAGALPRTSLGVWELTTHPQTGWGGAIPTYSRPLDVSGVCFYRIGLSTFILAMHHCPFPPHLFDATQCP